MAALASSWTASASASGSAASHECSSSLGIAAGHGGCISSHVSLAARLRLPLLSIDAVQGRPSCSGGRRARLQQVAAMENHVAADSFAAEQSPPADFAADVSTWDELGPSDVNLEESNSVQIPRERQRIFDSIAPVYDQLNDFLSLGQHRIWKRMAANWSRARSGHRVLDICCGSGDIAFLLAEKVGRQGSVVGVDFAPEQLAVAANRQKEMLGLLGVDMRWIEGDALALPFGDSEFDAATMGYGLRNVVDIPRSLREVWRVLKPGSSAAILDFNNSPNSLVSSFQGFMLDNVVVPVARQFGLAEQYEYLRPSIERFPSGREQVRLAREAGFSRAVHYELAAGLMGVLVVHK